MSNIIQFPVKEKVLTCGDCKVFEKCYDESVKIFGAETEEEKKASKSIPACEDIVK